MISRIQSFLNNHDYNINISRNSFYVSHYDKVLTIQDHYFVILFSDFLLKVNGSGFKLVKMADQELLISGKVKGLEINESM